MHNELSYSNYYPNQIFFYCLIPPAVGGETTILNGNTFIEKLNPEIMGDFFERNIKYIRNLHGGSGMGPSWQETYETDDKEKVDAFCKANNIKTFWKENNKLRLEQIRPTIITHPTTGKKVWFNQADQFHPSNNSEEVYEAMKMLYTKNDFPLYVCYEDDSEIPEVVFSHVREAFIEHTIKHPWQKGNLMLVDNVSALHGRNAFEGDRKVLISMI
jgi:alpha-ketoglutarate-dependent taurine dioxygenase